MITIDFGDLALHLGEEVAVSDWILLDQSCIDRFADATGDDQWIHVDPDRAAAESPFGVTIAHGFLTLALLPRMLATAMSAPTSIVVNYGLNRVRFTAPVPAGTRIRGRFSPVAVEPQGTAVDIVWGVRVEREDNGALAAVVEWILRYHPGDRPGAAR